MSGSADLSARHIAILATGYGAAAAITSSLQPENPKDRGSEARTQRPSAPGNWGAPKQRSWAGGWEPISLPTDPRMPGTSPTGNRGGIRQKNLRGAIVAIAVRVARATAGGRSVPYITSVVRRKTALTRAINSRIPNGLTR